MKEEATMRAIMTVTRVASNDDGDGNNGKSNGDGNKGARQATTRAMAVATTVAVMRVASNEEGEGGKAMEMVTRLVGKQWRWQQRGQWQWQQGWRARMRAMVRAARAMAMARSKRLHHGDVFLGLSVDATHFCSRP